MMRMEIPGYGILELNYLVMDYNGTLAIDGHLIPGVSERLEKLAGQMEVHVITADTFGLAREQLHGLPVTLKILAKTEQSRQKAHYIRELGTRFTVAVGNGRNDRFMLEEAQLGIATIQQEGASAETVQAANIVVNHISDALDLLLQPLRLKATLRD